MSEIPARDVKKQNQPYLDNMEIIHQKHMEILTDLLHYPTLGKAIPDITQRKDILLSCDLFQQYLDIPEKKSIDIEKEKYE